MKDRVYHLLYVDDEAELLEIGKLFLEKGGAIVVDTVSSADEALCRLADSEYDAVISDYQMPGMDGIALLAEVRKRYGNLPFILFTGRGREEVVIQAINNGADFYLQKGGEPTSQFAELEHKVRQAVRRTRAERDVKLREQQLAGMAANIPGVVFRCIVGHDRLVRFQYISERSHDILGLENNPDGFFDRFLAGLDPADRTGIEAAFGKARTVMSPLNFEARFSRSSGDAIWITVTASPTEGIEGTFFDGVLFDRTDQRRAEQALRESESTYRTLFTHTEAATIIIEKDLTIALANDAFLRMFGAPREEIDGKMKWTAFVAPEDQERMIRYHNIRRTDPHLAIPTVYEFQFVRKNGERRRIRIHVGMIQETSRSVASLIDLTEIRNAQEFLQESEERFRILSEMTIEGIVIHQKGIIQDMNPQFAAMFGYTPEELVGRNGFEFMMPESSREAIREWTLHGAAGRIIIEAIRKDKSRFFGELFSREILWKTKSCRVDTFTDITERRRSEEEIRQQRDKLAAAYDRLAAQDEELRQQYENLAARGQDIQEREAAYRTIFEQSPSAIALTRMSGEYVEVNEHFCRLFERTREQVIGKTRGEIWGIETATVEGIRQAFEEAQGSLDKYETRFPRGDRGDIVCLVSTRIIQFRGEPHVLTLIDDITEKKRAEETLRENYEALAQSRTRILESERRLSDIINFLPDATFAIDRGGTVIAWNRAIEAMTGVEAETIIGKAGYEYAIPFYGMKRPILIDLIFEDLETIESLYTNVKRDGNLLVAEAVVPGTYQGRGAYLWGIASPLYDSKGNLAGAIESIRDVSDRHRALDALHESEERFRQLADAAYEGIIIHEGGMIRDLNSRACELFGYSMEEMMGRDVLTLAEPATAEIVRQNIARGSILPYEARGRRKDGSTFWAELRSRNITAGDHTLRMTTIWDITIRKQIEMALKEKTEELDRKSRFYEILMRTSTDAIHVIDRYGRLREWNDAFLRHLGYTNEEAAALNVADWNTEWDSKDIRKKIHNLSDRGETLVTRHRRKDGTIRDVEINAVGFRIDNEDLLYASARDITDRKNTERELEKARVFTDAVMDSVPGLLYLYDQNGRLIRWNKAHETITGYSPEELGKMHVLDWYRGSKHDTETIRAGVEKTLREGYGFTEAWLQVKSGRKIPMYFTAVRVMIDEEPYFVGIGIDISDRKRAENEIRSANKKLNILSSITRHDILNKLTALRLFLELALENLDAARQEKFIRDALAAADTMQRQIEFTRYYQEIGVHEPQWKDLEMVIRSALSQIDTRGIGVTVACSGISVLVDPLIEKVFYNLVDNSLRHGVRVSQIRFSAQEHKGALLIVYEDDGVGIDADARGHLFRKGYGANTGLGLFLSREILAITGIAIRENGTPGGGARFEITVPPGGYRYAGRT